MRDVRVASGCRGSGLAVVQVGRDVIVVKSDCEEMKRVLFPQLVQCAT